MPISKCHIVNLGFLTNFPGRFPRPFGQSVFRSYQVPDVGRGCVDFPVAVDVLWDCGGVDARVGHGGRQDAAASGVDIIQSVSADPFWWPRTVLVSKLFIIRCHYPGDPVLQIIQGWFG